MLEWDNVVIGNSLSAVVKARQIGAKFLLNDETNFVPFDDQQEKFDKEYYSLAVEGLCPGSTSIDLVKIDHEKNEIRIFVEGMGSIVATYTNLFVFNSSRVSGLPFVVKNQVKENRVYDWFESNADRDNIYWEVEDLDSNFVKSVLFYEENKDGNGIMRRILPEEGKTAGNVFKKLVASSFISCDNLSNTEFSPSMARLKVLSMCKDAGITGVKNGYRGDTPKFKPLVITHEKRQVVSLYDYEMIRHGNITFDNGIENA